MGLADDLIRLVRRGADDALLIAAHRVAEQAKRNMPVGDPQADPDPQSNLRDSVHIEPSIQGGYIISVNAPHAAKQEFDQRLAHPRGGGPRYLQRALHEVMPQLDGIVAGKIDAETKTGRISDPSRSRRRRP